MHLSLAMNEEKLNARNGKGCGATTMVVDPILHERILRKIDLQIKKENNLAEARQKRRVMFEQQLKKEMAKVQTNQSNKDSPNDA
jgi:hypothetical protein